MRTSSSFRQLFVASLFVVVAAGCGTDTGAGADSNTTADDTGAADVNGTAGDTVAVDSNGSDDTNKAEDTAIAPDTTASDTAISDTAGDDTTADASSGVDTSAVDATVDDGAASDATIADDTADATANGACKSSADCPQPANGCTANVCLAGVCNPQALPDATPCSDGDACTAQASCQAGVCVASETVSCDDGKACTIDSCDANSGACKHDVAQLGGPCDDDDSCTQGTACDAAGKCKGGSNSCGCQSIQDCAAFDDGDACNGTLFCNLSLPTPACQVLPSSVVSCDTSLDGACTATACHPSSGQCLTLPAPNGQACDDGNDCTKGDACTKGSCTALVNTCQCQIAADCLGYDDGNACNGTLYCDTSALPHTCKVNPASIKTCPKPAGLCEVASCDAKTGACKVSPAAEGSPCEDGNSKTVGDACSKAVCVPGASVAQCSSDGDCAKWEDGDFCNGIKFCNKASGLCEDNPATVVKCPTVDDTACSKAACQPKTGLCTAVAASTGSPCDDGDVCTAGDSCQAGQCQGSANVCECKQDTDCKSKEDGDICNGTLYCDKVKGACLLNPASVVVCATAGDTACSSTACVAKTGICAAKSASDGKPCDDSNSCTSDDACSAGSCTGTKTCACQEDVDCAGQEDGDLCNGTLYCNKKSNSCEVNPATVKTCPTAGDSACQKTLCEPSSGSCKAVAASNGVSCDADANPCTQNDFCSAGVCKAGASVCECYSDDDCQAVAGGPADNKCILGMLCDATAHVCKPAQQVKCDTSGDGPCSVTACDAKDGVCKAKIQPVGTICGESAICAGAQLCDNKGGCQPGPSAKCDDADACTSDSCNSKTGCVFVALDSSGGTVHPCDDGNVCTSADACAKGQCNGTTKDCSDESPCTADACDPKTGCTHLPSEATTCNDGDVCSVGDFCFQGLCLSGSKVLPCDDGNPCTADSCDEVQGCVTKAQDGGKCDDGDGCTKFDACQGGGCKGVALSCDDGSGCTVDSCDKVEGCLHAPQTGKPCDDGNACTAGDACISSGLCASGAPKVCDDANPCTIDLCDPLQGCVQKEVVGSKCDDGNACTVNEKCDKGQCTGSPRDCDDGLVCSKDSCDKDAGCLYAVTAGGKCDDGNACTAGDSCVKGGACVPGPGLSCDDNNGCTTDACDPASGCTHKTLDGIGCNDGDSCTQGDKCVLGACKGSGKSCDDGLVCTTDGCDAAGGCTNKVQQGATCSDNDACTTGDACLQSGYCKSGVTVSCDDGKPCTTDVCLPQKGCENNVKTGAACSDDNACTAQDACSAQAVCVGSQISCDDGKACTTDSCDKLGGCKNLATTNASCDDGNACSTGDVCLASGACVATGNKVCNDNNSCTADSCDPKTGCVNAVQDKASCDDGSACTSGDACAGSSCVGSPVNCDDGQSCTKDSCDKAKGCVATAQTGVSCSDGNACTTGDTCSSAGTCAPGTGVNCDDGKPCTTDSCDKAAGCKNTALDGIGCSDGDACTQQDICGGGACKGTTQICDDGNACTTDSCDTKLGCKVSPKTGTSCNDNNPCSSSDVCDSAGKCVGTKVICNDNSVCTFDLCSTDVGCVYTKLSGASCNDNKVCTVNDSCSDGVCGGVTKVCDDDNLCTADSCDAVKGCVFADITNKVCDDGDECTVGDTCTKGGCAAIGPKVCGDGNDCTLETCHKLFGCLSTLAKPEAVCSDGDPCTVDWCDGLGSCTTVAQLGSRTLPAGHKARAIHVASDGMIWIVGESDSTANGAFIMRMPWRGKQPPLFYSPKLREYYAMAEIPQDKSSPRMLFLSRNWSKSGSYQEVAGSAYIVQFDPSTSMFTTFGEKWTTPSETGLYDAHYVMAANTSVVAIAGSRMGLAPGQNGVSLSRVSAVDESLLERQEWRPASLTGRDFVEVRGVAVNATGQVSALVVTSDASTTILTLLRMGSKGKVVAEELWRVGTNADLAPTVAAATHMVARPDGSFDLAMPYNTIIFNGYTHRHYGTDHVLVSSNNASNITNELRYLHLRLGRFVGITEDLQMMPMGRALTNPASIFALAKMPDLVAYGLSREAYFVQRSIIGGIEYDAVERRDPWGSLTCSDCMTKHAILCNNNECNVDECTSSDGKCSGSTSTSYCSDGNNCTTETCVSGKCVHTPVAAASNTACSLGTSMCKQGVGTCGNNSGLCIGQQSDKDCATTPNACRFDRCLSSAGCVSGPKAAGSICGDDGNGVPYYCPNSNGGTCGPAAAKYGSAGESNVAYVAEEPLELPKFGDGFAGTLKWFRVSVTVEIQDLPPFLAAAAFGGIDLKSVGGAFRVIPSASECQSDLTSRNCFAYGATTDTLVFPDDLSAMPSILGQAANSAIKPDGMRLIVKAATRFKVTAWKVDYVIAP